MVTINFGNRNFFELLRLGGLSFFSFGFWKVRRRGERERIFSFLSVPDMFPIALHFLSHILLLWFNFHVYKLEKDIEGWRWETKGGQHIQATVVWSAPQVPKTLVGGVK
jgi:hypothetical protein